MTQEAWLKVAHITDFATTNRHVINAGDRPVLILRHQDRFYAVDNRCPHMGFPLDQGSVKDCILTCHWHHARFDLASGGTFDQFADNVRAYPVAIRDDAIWIDTTPQHDARAYQLTRLRDGLERNIRLLIAKSAIALLDNNDDSREAFRVGLEFGSTYRVNGWGQGLTMLTCLMNMLPILNTEDRARALYQGLHAVAVDTAAMPPHFLIDPLPNQNVDLPTLKRWFRNFIEVRDDEGAERCIVTAVRSGASSVELADILFAAATDHRYLQTGHVLDFINKALEALDIAGWDMAGPVLASLIRGIAQADRMEESNAWRHPIDLIDILETAFAALPDAVKAGEAVRQAQATQVWDRRVPLAQQLLSDDPQANINALLAALHDGATSEQIAGTVAYTAALRIAHFHTSNEFSDWDTVLHTFTYANALHQRIRRITQGKSNRATPHTSIEQQTLPLLRGVLDATMSIFLDRFLNIPPAKIPKPGAQNEPKPVRELLPLLDHQQQVNQAGIFVAEQIATAYEHHKSVDQLLATIGKALLREDRNFHTIQAIEGAFAQYKLLQGTPEGMHMLIAAARYLAAHAPTVRAQEQTFQIAERLHRGEQLYEA
ncbi:MAG: Rieske (2Fe-2S) protein [Chloroflexi bacterium AL-W]|nr:Rieske (2Fe-2S) protein [Chloroflexi bacterium AL-N1]NOK67030.1 Rieske (2Fe-2S) protein [Chloroflexi bacterium AL-N10]NOK74678.1 Rieske (2Fe-2S) protein [Chloroflexi bacterium AL-N5]NOK81632.1 Rieske (2Fe-2S) protein [Chloroflexi bacterium AL-W]NOK89102.1 Rieske (2Fe-2S) protein [Chloroflexi bacterium AL-N15]